MKKRVLALIIMGVLFAGTLVGCSKSDLTASSSKSENTVTSSQKNSDGDYKALEIKEDWEQKATVSINGSEVSVDGTGAIASEGGVLISEGGSYVINGNSESVAIVVSSEDNVKLILNGVTLTNPNGPVIYCESAKNLYVELADGSENTLADGTEYETDDSGEAIGKAVISSKDDLILLGNGTLNINASYKHCIAGSDKVYIEEGIYNLTTTANDGINANDLICIDGGTFNITGVNDIMQSDDLLVVNGGTITGSSNKEGLEGKGSIYINGGTIDISVDDDGLNAGNYIEINDGEISIQCKSGDAIDCNGNYDGAIVINGGEVSAAGGDAPEGAFDNDNSSIVINGGTVVGLGAVNSPIDTEKSQQITVVYGAVEAEKSVEVKDSEENLVFSVTPSKSSSTMIISSPSFENGKTYNVYVGDEVVYTFTVESTVVEAGGSDEGMNGMGGHGGPGNNFDFNGEKPEGDFNGEPPEGFSGERPDNFNGQKPGQDKMQKDESNSNTNNNSL